MARSHVYIRQDDEQARELALAARVEEISVSELVRRAIAIYLNVCRNDPVFRERLSALRAADQRLFAETKEGE